MSAPIRLYVVYGQKVESSNFISGLGKIGFATTVVRPDRVFAECKAAPPTALLYFTPLEKEPKPFAGIIKQIHHSAPDMLVYVVSANMNQGILLLKDDGVEGVFATAPSPEVLLKIIQQSLSVRRAQSKRATPRYPVRFRCMIKVVGASGLVEAEVRQLGLGGFLAVMPRVPASIPHGERIRFAITSENTPTELRIEGDGDIRWGSSVETEDQKVGVKFGKLTSSSESQLLNYLNGLRTLLPAFTA